METKAIVRRVAIMGIGTQLFKVFTIASVLERYGSVKGLHNLLFVNYMLE